MLHLRVAAAAAAAVVVVVTGDAEQCLRRQRIPQVDLPGELMLVSSWGGGKSEETTRPE